MDAQQYGYTLAKELTRIGCTGHALAEFLNPRNTGLAKSTIRTLNFRRVNQ